jgi:cytochrome d ubiquinol oxidase subunit I
MRTSEAISPIAAPAVGWSLALFVVVYFAVFGTGTGFLLRMMDRPAGPTDSEPDAPQRSAGITPAPSLSGRSTAPAAA